MKTHLPGEPVVETRAPGFTIHIDLFDQAMVRAAVDAGAELMVSTSEGLSLPPHGNHGQNHQRYAAKFR